MKYLCQLLLWSFLGTTFDWVYAQRAERFVNEILGEYRTVDQAGRADTSRDGIITDREFALSLYKNADAEGNNDNGVTMNEFVDHYVKHYNISSELAIFMFDLLNDPGNKDNKITPNDITLRSFLGRDYASLNEYRDALQKWVTQAAKRLYNVLTSPHIIDRTNDVSPRYDILSNMDTNTDGFISYQELQDEFQKFSTNHGDFQINRNLWIERNVHSYGADPVTSILTFDYWDRNGDLVITSADLQVATLDLDRNGDGRISRQEYLQYFERGYKLSRRISGKSIQLPKRACPVPWWSKLRVSPSIDAVRAAMDFDDDFDGWISLNNVRRWLLLFDTDGDGLLSRNEYMVQQTTRYGVNSTIASTMFDLVDLNGDDHVGDDDWLPHFKDGIEISFCDARRSILDLARMAEKFNELPQASSKRTSMQESLNEDWNWFLQNEQASGWMALDPYNSENYPQNGLCQGHLACYEGEHTKTWGLPGASLWWIRGIASSWSPGMNNMAQISGGPLLAEVLPAVLMRGPLPFKRATDSPSSHSKSPNQNPRQIGRLGMPSSSQQFGGGDFRQYPNTNSNKGQLTNPLMKQYQRLFDHQPSFRPQGVGGVTNPMSFDANDRTGAGNSSPFSSQFHSDKQNRHFGPMRKEQDDFRTANEAQNIRPTAQSWQSSKTVDAHATPGSLTNFPMQNQPPQNSQLPFIGLSAYPLVLSLDPSSSLLWRAMARRRKALSHGIDKLTGKENNVEVTVTKETLNQRQKRDEDAAKGVQDQKDNANDTDEETIDMQWNPMLTGFSPSPFDIWMSWALEKFLWENQQVDSNSTDITNGTFEELNDLEDMWNEMEISHDDEHLSDKKTEEGDLEEEDNSPSSRQKRNINEGKSSEISDDRHKRWVLYVQRLRRNPYLHAMRNLWPRYYCFPPFDFSYWRNRARSPHSWYPCYMYNMFPWGQGMVFPYQTHTWRRYGLAKRSKREATDSETEDSDANMKRAFSFDNWFKNKQEKVKPFSKQNDNRFMSQIPASTNSWKTAESSKYGMKNNWGQRLEEESRQWGASSKETFDFNSNGKWKNHQIPNHRYQSGYSASPGYSSMGGRHPSFSDPANNRQWDTQRLNEEMFRMDPFNGGPSNFAAFLMPSLVGMSWKKRKIDNGPQQNYPDRMSHKFKHPNNLPSMASGLHQADWKQQQFSNYDHQWPNVMRNPPWSHGNDPSGFYDMFNQGPHMWNRRFLRKSSDKRSSSKEKDGTDLDMNLSKRQIRSVKDVENYRFTDLKQFLKNIVNKKSQVGAAKWMPWKSWKKLKSKARIDDSSKNTVISKSKRKFHSKSREKRSTQTHNIKRWIHNNPMWNDNGWNWNQWMNYQWNPWYNNYMRFPRESDEDTAGYSEQVGREKRDSEEDATRQKRFGMWNMMYPWYRQGNWNGMWNRWYPRNNWYRWGYMRYPRNSAAKDGKDATDQMDRTRRSSQDMERSKRWGYGDSMWYGNRWNWNNWKDYQWNPWYNNYMRFSRESDDTTKGLKEVKREKRDVEEDNLRQKRFGMWNMMSPWYGQGNWNDMWNQWYPRYNWYRWNNMRFSRDSKMEDGETTENLRQKREVQDTERTKRWGFGQPMWNGNGWNWNQWMNHQWNPWYNNMRFARDSEDVTADKEDVTRVTRDAKEDNPRQKRFGMWNNNMMYPWYGQGNWNSMWNQWYPRYNWYRWNNMRYQRDSKIEEGDNTEDIRQKRNTEDAERTKRWGFGQPMWHGSGWNWNQWMNYQWNPWYNNMRFARDSEDVTAEKEDGTRVKRDTEEDNPRQKRFGMWNNNMMHPWYGQGNWNSMWNRWYPRYNWYQWNNMRYPRDSATKDEDTTEDIRQKRDTEDAERTKRWGFGQPMWYGNGWNWNQWMNYQWNPWYNNMRFARDSEDLTAEKEDGTRVKRDTEEDNPRQKRFGMWNNNMMHPWYGQGNWNSMWNRWYPRYNWHRWNNMRYPRDSKIENGDSTDIRQKRETEDAERTKRWGFGQPMWYGNGWNWNNWMDHQWNPWYNHMRFARDSEDVTADKEDGTRVKRDAEDDNPRQKRFGMWNMMYPWYGQGNWNSMWNQWYPRYNWYRWNNMRYPRDSKIEAGDSTEDIRQKRNTEDAERTKRWGFGQPMWYGNGWNWNQWMNYQWNPWYNNMRFARDSEDLTAEKEDGTRVKRDTEEDNPREKRFGMWNNNMMYPWYGQGNWNSMWNQWYPRYNWYRWNNMRYPRDSATEDEDTTEDIRQKRDTEDAERTKRWGFGQPMWYGNGWNWNQWMNYQWNPWYNNMRFARDSEDVTTDKEDGTRVKRDTEEDNPRQKRFGMWNNNMMHPWYGQGNWNSMWNRWYPRYNWYQWNNMRYPRDSATKDEDTTEDIRQKRDTEDAERTKRWGFGQPMWYGNGWNWNQWMNYQWNPWYNNMRFARDSEDLTAEKEDGTRVKRDVEEDSPRQKRFGMWNNNMMYPWYGQGNWNSMWNRWYPRYNWYRWNNMRYPRDSKIENGDSTDIRHKRETEDAERTKRWGFGQPMWYGNGWNWNNWMDHQWNPWYNHMRFARDSEDVTAEKEDGTRVKRDTEEDNPRQKRFGMWNNNMMHPWYGQGNWNSMWNRWYPRYNWYRWNNMRYQRDSKIEAGDNTEDIRQKRNTEDAERTKRWGFGQPMWYENGWNWNQWMNYQWNPWYNNMRFARDSEDVTADKEDGTRVKRDVEEDSPRQKRFGMWNNNMMHPWYGQGNWNSMWNRWYPRYNWYRWNNMRYPRDSATKDEDTTEDIRQKRDTEDAERTKRWGFGQPMWYGNGWNWNQWMNYQWNPWYNNMRFARDSEDLTAEKEDGTRVKRDVEEDSPRQKRFGMWNNNMMYPWYGQGNWNSMWNRWYPRYNWYQWNNMRYPRDSATKDEDTTEDIKQKRETEDAERTKRWGFGQPMWYGNGWNWNNWMDHQWNPWYNHMRFARDSEDVTAEKEDGTRVKRDTEEDNPRQKRFGMWNNNMMHPWYGQGNWNSMWNRWYPRYNWYRWNNMRYQRDSKIEAGDNTEDIRQKRNTEDAERTKRWGFGQPMWYENGWNWNQWMNYQWNPWYNNMRFARDSEDVTADKEDGTRVKRDVEEDSPRQKRFGMWNNNMMYPWYGQGNWNSMWNRWYPRYNWYRWNNMRYPRDSATKDEDTTEDIRQKRDTEDAERTKRWGFGQPMWYGNGWNWNQWMNYQWNPWYNNMRFARDSEDLTAEKEDGTRVKRDVEEDSPRQKRFGMWNNNMMYPWYGQGNWNSMWNRWYPRYNWYQWNNMRYPRDSATKDEDTTEDIKQKRDTEDAERTKRWGFGQPMWYGNGWNWNQWMNYQWNPWYNNMRFARDSEDLTAEKEDGTRVKRDVEEDSPRQKRFGMWNNNMMYPWYGQGNWNSMWNRWYPRYNWYQWNNMRYPRDSATKDEDTTEDIRQKRDTEDAERTKRWGFGQPMWYGNGWNWNQWMNYQWNPWYNNMRFARDSEDLTAEKEDGTRVKRDTKEDNPRQKRFGMWNNNMMHPWYGQGNWNSMWNRWYPRYNWYRWNNMRYPRDSKIENGDSTDIRQKRETEDAERTKRWGFGQPMWYGNGWNWNNWMDHQWNPWYNNMRFARDLEDVTADKEDGTRVKRDTEEDNPRQKRFGMWNMMYPWYGQGNWNSMWKQWYPRYNWYRWNNMRYPRDSKIEAGDSTEAMRQKRNTEDAERTKRWGFGQPMWYGNGWNWNQWMNYQWNPWYNNMRFARDSEDVTADKGDMTRVKRDAEDNPREKRFGMWNNNMMYPWYGQGNWNSMWNRWYPRYNWYRWNNMRYSRDSKIEDGDSTKDIRQKRETEDAERTKRWGFGQPMWYGNGWNWNNWMDFQWSPWYNNMRFARDSDDVTAEKEDGTKVKRDAEEDNPRQKRFGMWNMMYPWYGQGNWNSMWNRWYPRYNWYRWNNMRYPRNSATKDEDTTEDIRQKRETEDTNRAKRWGFGQPMWYGNGWNWNQWMNGRWNPWYNNYNMRFGRESRKDGDNGLRHKRETPQTNKKEVTTDFQKRLANLKKNAFSAQIPSSDRFGSSNGNTMRQLVQNKQNGRIKPMGNEWMVRPRMNHGDGNAWSTKWRRWMDRDWMDSSKRTNNFPWPNPRFQWMWQREQWGNPMMFNRNPWFGNGGWW